MTLPAPGLEEVRRLRLARQLLVGSTLDDPAAVVERLLAVQAQEYAMVRWALALRIAGDVTDDEVERAFDDGRVLRFHALRPTWHAVAAPDVRLVLQVTAPRVHQANAYQYRSLDLGPTERARFADWVGGLLAGGNHLTREEIRSAAPAGWVEPAGFQLAYLLMHAELEGVVTSGLRRGNQGTYALLDERVGPRVERDEEEALMEFVRRYLTTRGPATVPDLTTWSGLTVAQVRRALAALGDAVVTREWGGRAYLLTEDGPPAAGTRTCLLPDYDEYGMSYRDRSAIAATADPAVTPWNRAVVADGVVAGSWRRTLARDTVRVEARLHDPGDEPRAAGAAESFARFLGRGLELEVSHG